MVQREILEDAPALHLDDFAFVVHEIVDGEIFFQRVVDAVEAALLQAGEIEGRFAQRFAGDRAGVDATAADVLGALDDRHALAEVGGLSAGFFASGAAADHDQVEEIRGIGAGWHANLLGAARGIVDERRNVA